MSYVYCYATVAYVCIPRSFLVMFVIRERLYAHPVFQKVLVSPVSGQSKKCFLWYNTRVVFYLLRNAGYYVPMYTASCARIPES